MAILGLAALPVWAQSHENFTGAPEAPLPASNGPIWQGPEGTVLWNNGPLVTHPGAGFGGADESRLQSVSLTMNTIGFGHQVLNNNRVADDFTVPAGGWNINAITFFAYQTGSTTTSTFTAVNFRIWNGPPNAGGMVVVDMSGLATLSSSTFANIYRVTETTIGNNTRPVFANTQNVAINLGPGTYWLDWQTNGTLASGPWAPPVTMIGTATTGNGLQSLAGTWGLALDTGAAMAQQAFPFIIEGTLGASSDLAVTKSCTNGSVGGNATCTITVTNNGPDSANSVVVTDSLPAGLTYVSNDCGAGFANPTLTWNVGTLANAASATCNVVVTSAVAAMYTNTATATSNSSDPSPNNNSGSDTFDFTALVSDVSVTKSCTETVPGGNATCTITVSNAGPDAATNVVATDAIPAGLTYVSNDCGAVFASPNLTWTIGALAANASVSCNVLVTSAVAGTFTNTAIVSADGQDPATSNNSSTSTFGFVVGPPGIPTLGGWGLAALVVLLVGSALFVLRRRG
ncbi:MAG TPA: hypothetical protein VF017_19960 [Thermoanaerobaculia bacterium]|nr:hypothetical protein [Thermoanaerobaculia bacterium]